MECMQYKNFKIPLKIPCIPLQLSMDICPATGSNGSTVHALFFSLDVNRLHRQGSLHRWGVGKHCSITHGNAHWCIDNSAWIEQPFLPCFLYGQIGFVRTMNKSTLLWKESVSKIVTKNAFLIQCCFLCWQWEKWMQHCSSFLEHDPTICCNWEVSFQLETFNYPYKGVTKSLLA